MPRERGVEPRQRPVQPPARRPAERGPGAGARVVDEDAHERPAGFDRTRQRGLIGHAQIVAEPDDRGSNGRLGGHGHLDDESEKRCVLSRLRGAVSTPPTVGPTLPPRRAR